jgi:hypothetical protein
VSDKGHAFIDRTLYLPKAWTDDPTRMAAAHVPPTTTFATCPQGDASSPTSAPAPKTCFSINALSGVNRFRHHRVGRSRSGFLGWEAPGRRVAG